MNTFFLKLAMLLMFLLAVTCIWAALFMVFPVTLINILLGILGAFFLLRGFELADRINNLGPYSGEDSGPKNNKADEDTAADSDGDLK